MAKFRLYNRTLCPDIWDRYQHLNPRVRVNLLRMATDFYTKSKFPAPIIDIYLMGSSANYNWSPDSDVDVHVLIDFNQLKMPTDTASQSVKTAGAQWNIEHEVFVKGHKVELNIQNVADQKPHVTGIYSLLKDQWIRKPKLQLPQINTQLVQVQFSGMKRYIDEVIASGDRERMKEAKKYVDAYRQYGLDTAGELSVENIVFKVLRSRGLVKKLKDSINVVYDKELTVKERFTDRVHKDNSFYMRETNENKRFTLSSPDQNGVIPINLDGTRIAQVFKLTAGWGEQQNRWVFNRGGGAIDLGFPSLDKSYDTPEEILVDLEHLFVTLPSKKITEGKEDDDYAIERIPYLTDDTLLISITKWTDPPHANVQVDEIFNGKDMFSSNPEFLIANGYQMPSSKELLKLPMGKYKLSDAKKMLKSMNEVFIKPINESPLMTKQGATALAGDKPLKGKDVEEVIGNIVVFRQGTPNGIFAEGWTLVYFMDSDESAQAIKQGKIPYLTVPVGTFYSGGSPITDIWKKKFQKPGTEHILGVIQGHSDDKSIFIDMITVRPGWKRNHIAKLMMDRLKKTFPEAKLTTSSRTNDGEKLFKSYNGEEQRTDERFGAGIPEDILPELKQRYSTLKEVKHSDIKQRLPQTVVKQDDVGNLMLNMLILDNLKALRAKTARMVKGTSEKSDPTSMEINKWAMQDFIRYNDEFKKRIATLNIPITTEGFGAGIPETDRLKIKNDDSSVRRWQIRSKDAPKTPKMKNEIVLSVTEYDEPQRGDCLSEGLIMESPRQKNLKKNRKPLTDEERAEVMKAKAVWHHGPKGEETPAVWKAVVNGKTWYCCNTHRAIQIKPTLKGAIKAFDFIKTTA